MPPGTNLCLLVITSNPAAIIHHGVLPSLDPRCKHQIIYSQINFHVPPPPKYKRTFWDYKACNLNALKNDLRNIDWTQAFGNLDVNQMVDFFTCNLLNPFCTNDVYRRHEKCFPIADDVY